MSENTVPWLRAGVGETPAEGGCIMQVIDWIHRESWTDSPPCVHPVLRKLAIYVNDQADDVGRQELLDLAPRLMGTNSEDRVLSVRLATFCAREVLSIFEAKYPNDDRPRKAIEVAEAYAEDPSVANTAYTAHAAHAAHAAYAAAYAADDAYANAAYAAANAANAADDAYANARRLRRQRRRLRLRQRRPTPPPMPPTPPTRCSFECSTNTTVSRVAKPSGTST